MAEVSASSFEAYRAPEAPETFHTVKTKSATLGPSGWREVFPHPNAYPELEHSVQADWVVVGAGFAGVSAARRLKENCPTDRIVLLEALEIGEGPSGRNSGFMIDLPHKLNSDSYTDQLDADRRLIGLNRQGIDYAVKALDDYELDPAIIHRAGKINVAATEKGKAYLASYSEHLQNLEEPHSHLDARQLAEITGSKYYTSGLLTPKTNLVHPVAYIQSLTKALHDRGVMVFEKSPVVRFGKGSPNRLQTPKGEVIAPNVILAVNGHIQGFDYFKDNLMHIFTFASMTRALLSEEVKKIGSTENWGLIPADPMGTTVRRLDGPLYGGHRILIRNRFEFCADARSYGVARIRRIAALHGKSFEDRYPDLKDVPMEYMWGGRLCLSYNTVPAFGEVDKGVFAAACQNGLGTVNGTLSGMLIADLASGNKKTADLVSAYQSKPAPSRVLPPPLMSVLGNVVIRYRESRAGAEF